MTNSRIKYVYETPQQVAEAFADVLAERISSTEHFHLALSGGSTPKLLFKLLAAHYKARIEWGKLHLYWGDERCVPPDHEESNYKMTHELLLKHVHIPLQQIHRIQGEADPVKEAVRYGQLIHERVPMGTSIPRFDMIMLGMGGDGHTASIFPNQMELLHSDNICEVATHPDSGQQRVSLTGNVINHAQEIAFLVTGAGKADRLYDIWHQEPSESPYPAAHIQSIEGRTVWYLDQAAAERLT